MPSFLDPIPAPTARFRPRADASLLHTAIQDAWAAKGRALEESFKRDDIAEIVAADLERRYPAADMEVLARYGHAKPADQCTVNSDGQRFGITLPRPVTVPTSYGYADAEAWAGGTRYSEMPGYGLKPSYLASLTPAELESYLADHRKSEARLLPRSVEPFFASMVAARKAHQNEYHQARAFPQDRKETTGEWPRWSEIEAAFPVLGEHIAKLRVEHAERMARHAATDAAARAA